jgi:hypothetical protein
MLPGEYENYLKGNGKAYLADHRDQSVTEADGETLKLNDYKIPICDPATKRASFPVR